MPEKDAMFKFRLPAKDKEAIHRAAKLARIPASVLIRLCLTSRHSLETDGKVLRKAATQ